MLHVDRERNIDRAKSQPHGDAAVKPLKTHNAACYVYVIG